MAPNTTTPSGLPSQALGIALFLFIPLVLFLYVGHPEPIGASLVGGVVLMLGHRFLARPYMRSVQKRKCLWCNRWLVGKEAEPIELETGGGPLEARCCPDHREPALRFFSFVDRWRWPLRLGIFVPLLALLVSLAVAAFGKEAPLEEATSWFRLVIGLTVNLAAFGYLAARAADRPTVPFPAHNFFLLGVRALLWVFRLMGAWWIWLALRYFLA